MNPSGSNIDESAIRNKYQEKLILCRVRGYKTKKLEDLVANGDLQTLRREFAIFTRSLQELLKLKKKLDSMNTESFEEEVKAIRVKLFDPEALSEVKREIASLEAKIDLLRQRDDELIEILDDSPEIGEGVALKYTFSNFLIDGENCLAYSASREVAEAPTQRYNPLYIYGETGAGKTHLLRSIVNLIEERDPDVKVLYLSADELAKELSNLALESNDNRYKKGTFADYKTQGSGNFCFKKDSRKKSYQNSKVPFEVDVLLIDDIQTIDDNKMRDIFTLLDSLFLANKQVVMASDRPPSSLPAMDRKLHLRFENGLVVPIRAIDQEEAREQQNRGKAISLKNVAEVSHKKISRKVSNPDIRVDQTISGSYGENPKATKKLSFSKRGEYENRLEEEWDSDDYRLEMKWGL